MKIHFFLLARQLSQPARRLASKAWPARLRLGPGRLAGQLAGRPGPAAHRLAGSAGRASGAGRQAPGAGPGAGSLPCARCGSYSRNSSGGWSLEAALADTTLADTTYGFCGPRSFKISLARLLTRACASQTSDNLVNSGPFSKCIWQSQGLFLIDFDFS